ncbi:MAG: hypothetical protein IJV31_07065 [Clostridia bacterium]|nr:hypothetical protein [Clostridia bacterium]MBR1718750.1 hypothetical protein [Bacilli bacterium]
MELTPYQETIVNLETQLQTAMTVRKLQVNCLELAKQLFGKEDFTYKNTLESIKLSQKNITKLKRNLEILKKSEDKWNSK